MGIEVAIAAVGLAVGAKSAADARKQQRSAEKSQKRAQREQKGMQAQQAAQERRQQVREERVRRAQVLQASQGSGVSGGSGELGAVGNLATQLSSNIGFNTGMLQGANRISDFNQSAANSLGRAQTSQQMSGLGMSIFQQAGGFNTLASPFRDSGSSAPVQERGFNR